MGIFDSKADKEIDKQHEEALKTQLKGIDTKYSDLDAIKDDTARRAEKLEIKEKYGVDHHELKKQEVALAKGMSGIHGEKEKAELKENTAFNKQEEKFRKPHETTLENINKVEAKALKGLKSEGVTGEQLKEKHEEITKRFAGYREEENGRYEKAAGTRSKAHDAIMTGLATAYEGQAEKLKKENPQAAILQEEEKKKTGPAVGEDEEKKRKNQQTTGVKQDQKRSVGGFDISGAKSFSDVQDIFSKSSKEGLFVRNLSEDGKSETHTDPKVLAAVMKNNNYKGSKEDFLKGIETNQITISEKDQQKLADNTITYTLNKDGTVKDMASGKEVNAVGIVDGNVIKTTNGKTSTLFKETANTKEIPVKLAAETEVTPKDAEKDTAAGKDTAGKPVGHQQDNPLNRDNGTILEPENVEAAFRTGHISREERKMKLDALERDNPKATSMRGDFLQDQAIPESTMRAAEAVIPKGKVTDGIEAFKKAASEKGGAANGKTHEVSGPVVVNAKAPSAPAIGKG